MVNRSNNEILKNYFYSLTFGIFHFLMLNLLSILVLKYLDGEGVVLLAVLNGFHYDYYENLSWLKFINYSVSRVCFYLFRKFGFGIFMSDFVEAAMFSSSNGVGMNMGSLFTFCFWNSGVTMLSCA